MNKKLSSHAHDYKEIKLIRLTRVQKLYRGTTGDKAILVRVCECKKQQAFEMGNTKEMVALGKRLKNA